MPTIQCQETAGETLQPCKAGGETQQRDEAAGEAHQRHEAGGETHQRHEAGGETHQRHEAEIVSPYEAERLARAALAPQLLGWAEAMASRECDQLMESIGTGPEQLRYALAAGLLSLDDVDAMSQSSPPEEAADWREAGGALAASVASRLRLLWMAKALVRAAAARGRTRGLDAAVSAASAAARSMGDRTKRQRRSGAAAAAQALRAWGKAGKFERECFAVWALAARRLHGAAEEEEVHSRGVEWGVWADKLQRPVELLHKTLRRQPFWDAAALPAARALASAHAEILKELCDHLASPAASESKQAGFTTYQSSVVSSGEWSDIQLFACCRRDEANCARFPLTSTRVASISAFNEVIFGSHFFSRLSPGTHLEPHCGPSNLRLRCHLGLVVPPGTRIRVADVTREWQSGECLVFDDSFEHEVWHDGHSDRIVLICDMWHPEVDVDAMAAQLLNDEQRSTLEYARKGQHIPLDERGYSTGNTVTRTFT
ncbi:hypothetical protein AB1Y20_018210 [Prymnesium parvum]|uniref:Aspartyl/asparaginy/proline hydroxylase domain-containing protein n=1 Tax=Prymnesium parvum TaxID=97485 RepID=A0AB34JMG9_PRYPA